MARASRCVERSVRVYERLIKAYPAEFRRQYGDEMARVFRELATDAHRRSGAAGLMTMWFRVLGDLLWTAPREHRMEMKRRIAVKTAPVTKRTLTLAVLLAALLGVAAYRVFWQVPHPIVNPAQVAQLWTGPR